MPTYEYLCEECRHEWEMEQSIKADPLTICTKCKKETAKRLISKSAFILEGGGWAKDSYGK